MIYLLIVYLFCFGLTTFLNAKDFYSKTEIVFIMIFIPFVMAWEVIVPYFDRAMYKLGRKRLQKDFGVDNVRKLTDNKDAQFLFVQNKVRRFFNIWLYTLFGIKRKVRDKDKFQQPRRKYELK